MIRKVQLDISDTNSLFSDITVACYAELIKKHLIKIYNENVSRCWCSLCSISIFKGNIVFLHIGFEFVYCTFSETVKLQDFLFRIL